MRSPSHSYQVPLATSLTTSLLLPVLSETGLAAKTALTKNSILKHPNGKKEPCCGVEASSFSW